MASLWSCFDDLEDDEIEEIVVLDEDDDPDTVWCDNCQRDVAIVVMEGELFPETCPVCGLRLE